jgi:MoaA/NifB/PqqE/SkfB family radical SAM enzyme
MLNLKKKISRIKSNSYFFFIEKAEKAINNKVIRKVLLNQLDKKMQRSLEKESKTDLYAVRLKKHQWVKALIKQLLKNYDKGYISHSVLKKGIEIFKVNNFLKEGNASSTKKAKDYFKKKYNTEAPFFVVVSPTQICNLKCKDCYAASSSETGATIPFDVFDRILKENHDIFGSRFVTISGGEPLMYRSQGKDLLDIFEKYSDTFFIFYTNGTLITKEIAERLAKIGNAFPQISVEGFEKETDERRGKGVFQRVLKSMEYLREAGVPFVISVTATRKNMDILLSDKFYDFWFEKQGASYMWQFQLMPIGRGKEVFDQMPTPEERVKLYRKWESLLEKGYPFADFWNSGVLSDGCIAYGRPGGYIYIDWNGNIMPCVFIPYYVDNVYDLYKKGRTIADALFSDFFKKGREWQCSFGFACRKKAKNWLMPCSIRDHYKYFKKKVLSKDVRGEDKFAEEAKNSEEYYNGLVNYDKKLKELTQPIWKKEYQNEDEQEN